MQPLQSFGGACLWPVFATDPSAETELVDQIKKWSVVQFAGVWLVAIRHTGNLDVANAAVLRIVKVLSQFCGDIAFDDLAVVKIHLYLEIRRADLRDDGMGIILAVEAYPGISRGLMGSISMSLPAVEASSAAHARFVTYVSRSAERSMPVGITPAIT